MSQRTLVLLKPDAVRRGLIGEIVGRIERKADWQITALELRALDRTTLEQHYAEHAGSPFYEPLVEFMAVRAGRSADRAGGAGHRGAAGARRADRSDRRRARLHPG